MLTVRKIFLPMMLAALGALSVLSAPPVEAAATSNYFQNHVLDATFRAQTALTPTTHNIGLYTGTINAQSCGGEVSGGSYGRAPITSSLANFSGTQGAGTTSASSNSTGSSGTISNNNAVTYSAPTANWGTITGFCDFDSSSGGNELIYA